MTNFFYFSVAKPVEDMTDDEVLQEYESSQRYYAVCRECGQGVNSKEHVRDKAAFNEANRRGLVTQLVDIISRYEPAESY